MVQPPVAQSALLQELRISGRNDLAFRLLDARSRVDAYLRGVHQTFAHYTSHAVDHSDEIILQLSALIFDTRGRRRLELNPIEIYLLCMGAYLHDAGMVVTDREKLVELESTEWERLSMEPLGRERQLSISTYLEPPVSDTDLYLAGLEQRLLLAEAFRRRHAQRAALAINAGLNVAHDYLEGDPIATRTLEAICVGHGLSQRDLLDDVVYPIRRSVFGHEVNVRLLGALLRIGDLLDVRQQRACPLMASLNSPMPRDSGAHWRQYNAIDDRLTSPEEIRVHAICDDAEEHRLLRDWFTWLQSEIEGLPRLLVGSDRHRSWAVPRVAIDGPNPTILIERKAGLSYRVVDWRFELDRNDVLARLIESVRPGVFGFLDELVQNAIDAIRSRRSAGLPSLRDDYVEVRLNRDESGAIAAITVEDNGIGMSEATVTNYLLQVGRSWYSSPEFRQSHSFTPAGRFGVGFLSCFAASDNVVVSTRAAHEPSQAGLKIVMPGPRSYLIVEEIAKPDVGTEVRVELRDSIEVSPGKVGEMTDVRSRDPIEVLRRFCVATEVPVRLRDGTNETVFPEARGEPLPAPLGSKRQIVSLEGEDCDGEAEFLVASTDGKEEWDRDSEKEHEWDLNAPARTDLIGRSWLAVAGLQYRDYQPDSRQSVAVRLNVHSYLRGLDLSKGNIDPEPYLGPLREAVWSHLESVDPSSYRYRYRVALRFTFLGRDWADNLPATRRVFDNGQPIYPSHAEIVSQELLSVVMSARSQTGLGQSVALHQEEDEEELVRSIDRPYWCIASVDLEHGVGLATQLAVSSSFRPIGLVWHHEPCLGWEVQLRKSRLGEEWLRFPAVDVEGGPDDLVIWKRGAFGPLWNSAHPFVEAMCGISDLSVEVNSLIDRVMSGPAETRQARLRRLIDELSRRSGGASLVPWRDVEFDLRSGSIHSEVRPDETRGR